jgi:DNA-binding GntR family transcriptional regulator
MVASSPRPAVLAPSNALSTELGVRCQYILMNASLDIHRMMVLMAEPTPPTMPPGAIDELHHATVDRSSPVPLYFQVAQWLGADIRSGALAPGTHLGEHDLARRLGVSRPTVRQAIGYLVEQGLLIKRRGIGTMVASTQVRRPLGLTSLYDDLSEAGQRPTTQLRRLDSTPCPEEAARALQVAEGSPVLFIERLRSGGGKPIALMHNYLPADLGWIQREQLEATGLYRLLRANRIQLRLATQTISARLAKAQEAKLLDVAAGAPLLVMRRTTFDDASRPVEFGSHVYPAERYSFEMTLVGR